MEYTVNIAIRTRHPLTRDALFAAAELGGVSQGRPGGRRLEATMTVSASDMPAAVAGAVGAVTTQVPGEPIAVEVMTVEEADRRLSEPPVEFVGIAEVAKMLGVSRQRASTLSQRDDFPVPVAKLAAGPVWRKGDLSTFAEGWQRKPGRPRRVVNGG